MPLLGARLSKNCWRNLRHGIRFQSSSAIHAPLSVPPPHRQLYQTLLSLEEDAAGFVDISRLQLALRSLESSNPVIRVALLGLGPRGGRAVKQLAKVLLSDELVEEQRWERELEGEHSALIRYGSEEEVVPSSPLAQTVLAPSALLKKHRLELLAMHWSVAMTEQEDAMLGPTMSVPGSTVRYPVHKALIVADGVDGTVESGRITVKSPLIKAVCNLPLRQDAGEGVVDVDLANDAISLLRADRSKGSEYSHKWQASQVSKLIPWLSPKVSETGLSEPVQQLIDSLLNQASSAIARAETGRNALSANMPSTKRRELEGLVSGWTQTAHSELQLHLAQAAELPSWRQTVWWKLIWRVDDVAAGAGDLLNSWLVRAESSLAYLCGRIDETIISTQKSSEPPNEHWPHAIEFNRNDILHTKIPELQRTAQSLFARALATTAGSSALGAVCALASPADMALALAFPALGIVVSLSRLQVKWTAARARYEAALAQRGREVIVYVEDQLRRVVSVRNVSQRSEFDGPKASIKVCRDALREAKGSETI
ncbi:hypothetical protein K470DRAFT_254134 [Piedraia hortae CBS 480.64]|uniref:Mmc1 C-terminal domain-containing protein n=1 Tax=Piedraia hortae CBS 480.64 TaxID=1314780 RepID=A0A6A7CAP6_9PEZI|nr:hypothetical protein K470DRAFT_254134 [Piedraia hortae CBS 480.64]